MANEWVSGLSPSDRFRIRSFDSAFANVHWIDDTFLHLFDEECIGVRQALDNSIWPREPRTGKFSWPALDKDLQAL